MTMPAAPLDRTGSDNRSGLEAAARGLDHAHLTRARLFAVLGALAIILLAAIITACAFGSVHVDLILAFTDRAGPDYAIFFTARLPRVLMAAVVGAALAASGAALQALVRNPLAEGGILGISGAGAFGAILALIAGARIGGSEAIVPLCAFGASLLSTVAVYRLAMVDGRLEPFTLLLVGVIFNSFWGAAIMIVNAIVNFYVVHSILFWLMGSFEAPTWREIATAAVLGAIGFSALFAHARDMNLLSLGDDAASELGVDVDRLRRAIFLWTSIMIGAAVSVSGIISFVGLIVPHMIRLALGPDHRLLLPAAFIGGAAFMIAADLLARTIIAPAELPVGAITALCGGPFFVYLLRRGGKGSLWS